MMKARLARFCYWLLLAEETRSGVLAHGFGGAFLANRTWGETHVATGSSGAHVLGVTLGIVVR